VFILTSGGTASASELIISGLQPYMNVTLVGTRTVGKNVASVTLYDSPSSFYLENDPTVVNPNHLYAIQPIIAQLTNADGFSDYTDGIMPDFEVRESGFLSDLKPLGDPEEPLLAEALAIIGGVARVHAEREAPSGNTETIYNSKERNPRLYTSRLDFKL
jgi:C-terminal processing protease CtpA/Prc